MIKIIFVVFMTIVGGQVFAQADLQVEALLRQYSLKNSNVSILVAPVNSVMAASALVALQEKNALNPASTMKVVTTAAALDLLGPSYRFKTGVYTTATPKNGILPGDLYIKGYGDPSMVSEQLWRLVMDLKDRGIGEIKGNLIGDDSALPTTGWHRQFSTNMSSNSANGPLSLNYNHIQIWVQPTAVGVAPKISVDPPVGSFIKIDNRAIVIAGSTNRLEADFTQRDDGGLLLVVRGQIGSQLAPQQIYRSVPSPTLYYLSAFRGLFESAGGVIRGKLSIGEVPETARLFYEKESEAYLSQILILQNKYSNNFIAEQLVMSMGVAMRGGQTSASTLASTLASKDPLDVAALGAKYLNDFAKRIGVNTSGMVIANGSGLSRQNRLSAEQLVQVLGWAA
jgi:D-alanyl-D-alanine carboxypeptidase/D-alanyl-D-alanine-endopeptidase (penicillin-binding protein 4)